MKKITVTCDNAEGQTEWKGSWDVEDDVAARQRDKILAHQRAVEDEAAKETPICGMTHHAVVAAEHASIDDRKYRVTRITHWSEPEKVIKEWGLWRHQSVVEAMADDGYGGEESATNKLLRLEVGQSFQTSFEEWHDQPTDWVTIHRVSDDTIIPDRRSWFDKAIQFIFNHRLRFTKSRKERNNL